jgi:pimeloyl-ACP methyl ester carboxylesterase
MTRVVGAGPASPAASFAARWGGRGFVTDLGGPVGLTPAAGRSATVHANARLLYRFADEVAGSPAVLVGNSMGGTISILLAHAHPDAVAACPGWSTTLLPGVGHTPQLEAPGDVLTAIGRWGKRHPGLTGSSGGAR